MILAHALQPTRRKHKPSLRINKPLINAARPRLDGAALQLGPILQQSRRRSFEHRFEGSELYRVRFWAVLHIVCIVQSC